MLSLFGSITSPQLDFLISTKLSKISKINILTCKDVGTATLLFCVEATNRALQEEWTSVEIRECDSSVFKTTLRGSTEVAYPGHHHRDDLPSTILSTFLQELVLVGTSRGIMGYLSFPQMNSIEGSTTFWGSDFLGSRSLTHSCWSILPP